VTRAQRTLHARLWAILGPLLLIALLAAVLARPAATLPAPAAGAAAP
jgi:hypothetical protein